MLTKQSKRQRLQRQRKQNLRPKSNPRHQSQLKHNQSRPPSRRRQQPPNLPPKQPRLRRQSNDHQLQRNRPRRATATEVHTRRKLHLRTTKTL